jgi:hypothetical protein
MTEKKLDLIKLASGKMAETRASASQIVNHPVFLSELNGRNRKGEEFPAPQSTADQKSKDGIVAFAPKTIALGVQQERAILIGAEPVSQSHPIRRTPLTRRIRGKFWTEQAGTSCLIRYTPDRRPGGG